MGRLAAEGEKLPGRFARWYRDEAGAMSGFILFVLPVLLLAVLGFHALWEVVSMRQALRVGTYQAARYLSAEPVQNGSAGEWNREAQRIVLSELRHNVVLRAADRGQLTNQDARAISIEVRVEDPVPSDAQCRGSGTGTVPFTVETRLRFFIDLLPGAPVIDGLSVPFNLVERQAGEVRCEPR